MVDVLYTAFKDWGPFGSCVFLVVFWYFYIRPREESSSSSILKNVRKNHVDEIEELKEMFDKEWLERYVIEKLDHTLTLFYKIQAKFEAEFGTDNNKGNIYKNMEDLKKDMDHIKNSINTITTSLINLKK